VHLAVEAMRWAFLDRNTALGDPDFMVNPVGRLFNLFMIGTAYLHARACLILRLW
jgi:gamma-glutamyltranspeptidase